MLSVIEINKANLEHNLALFKNKLPVGCKLVFVLKANAYGHGLEEVARVGENYVDYFQVDDFLELKALRRITSKPILVLGFVSNKELEEAIKLDGIFGVYDLGKISKLNEVAELQGKIVKIHLKIDAFLGRQGILNNDARKFAEEIKKFKNIMLEAVYGHFSNIEDVENLDHAKLQHKTLLEAKEMFKTNGFMDIFHHISATGGFLSDLKDNWGGSLLRLGIGAYGLWPSEHLQQSCGKDFPIRPVLSWKTKVAQVKNLPANYPINYGLTYITKQPMKVAVVPQGYSDGYDRGFSSNSEVLIGGTRCSVLGRIAMNMFVVDVSHLPDVRAEDEVVLIGKQGGEEITAEELAKRIGTINYEIVARLSALVPKILTLTA